MSNSTLAKFRAAVVGERTPWEDPRDGTVVVRHGDILFVADGTRHSIPLQSVFDINTGTAPTLFGSLPGVPVTIAYNDGEDRVVAALGAKAELVEKFIPVVFKTLLNDTLVTVKHPARRGGRVTNASFVSALLAVSNQAVTFDTDEQQIRLVIDAVVGFSRQSHSVDGAQLPTLVVRHIEDGTAVTTLAATESARVLSLLGRYLRRQYDSRLAKLQTLSLSEPEIETLVTLYSTQGTGVSFVDVLGVPSETVRALLTSLQHDSLVRNTSSGPALTTTGQIVVNQYLERINS